MTFFTFPEDRDMKPVTIHENQRGLLFKDGRFLRPLAPGRHRLPGRQLAEVLPLEDAVRSDRCTLDALLENAELAAPVTVVEVGDRQLALCFLDGKFSCALCKGKYAFWNTRQTRTWRLVDISSPTVADDVPTYLFRLLPPSLYLRAEVAEHQRARLCYDRRFVRLLEPGVYYFWKNDVKVELTYVDTRLTQETITGQELLTLDKVSVRLSFVCSYRIADCLRVLTEIDDWAEQLHVAAQLAMREFVGRRRLDELLESREEISAFVLARLREKAPALFLEIVDGGVRDIILPGEIREIMNTVLIAEKRAQASVITRREEVASTRSLLNTAKLMDENRTLRRLKELEYMERICGSVGTISLSSSGDLLGQLTALLGGSSAS